MPRQGPTCAGYLNNSRLPLGCKTHLGPASPPQNPCCNPPTCDSAAAVQMEFIRRASRSTVASKSASAWQRVMVYISSLLAS